MSTREALYDEVQTLRTRVEGAEADTERLEKAIKWVIEDMGYTAPEMMVSKIDIWYRHLHSAVFPEVDE